MISSLCAGPHCPWLLFHLPRSTPEPSTLSSSTVPYLGQNLLSLRFFITWTPRSDMEQQEIGDVGEETSDTLVCPSKKSSSAATLVVEARVFAPGLLSPQRQSQRANCGVSGRRRPPTRRQGGMKDDALDQCCAYDKSSCREPRPNRAPFAGDQVEDFEPFSPVFFKNMDEHCGSLKSPYRRRSSSCPTPRGLTKSPRLTQTQRVARPAPAESSKVPVVEKAIDNLEIVMSEFQQGIRARDYTDGDLAARNGHMYIARFVARKFTNQAMVLAASQGHLEMITFLHHNRSEGTTTDAMDAAATYGHLHVVRWLHMNREEGCTTRAMDGAARNGHIQVVEFLGRHRVEGGTSEAIDAAAASGHLDVVRWLTANMPDVHATTRAMDTAACEGHLEMVKILHESRQEGCTTEAMDSAARRGHLEVVQFLHQYRKEGCTTAAMNNAAAGGHALVLKYLGSNLAEGCTEYAMIMAAWNGHLGIVQWLHKNRAEVVRGVVVTVIEGKGDHEAKPLERPGGARVDDRKFVQPTISFTRTQGCTPSAMNGAAYNGHLGVVKWLHANRTEGCTTTAMDVSAMNGHLEVVKWLHANRSEGCTTDAMDWAAKEGRLGIIKWLHANRQERCTQAAVDWAASNGHIEVLQWLVRKCGVGYSPRAFDWATKNGHSEVMKFLEGIRPR